MMMDLSAPLSPHQSLELPHLQPVLWQKVNRLHLCKAISEFSHECLLAPQRMTDHPDSEGYDYYQLVAAAADKPANYVFRARRLALDHWLIDQIRCIKPLMKRAQI